VGERKLSGVIGGGLCTASFALILGSVVTHLAGLELYVFLILVFLVGAGLFIRAMAPDQVAVRGTAEPEIERPAPVLPPPSLAAGQGTYSRAGIEAEIGEPFIAGTLLRINVGSKFGSRDGEGKYYVEAFGIEGQFPARLLAGPWRVPWNDAPAGRPRKLSWRSTDLRLAEWPEGGYGRQKRRGRRGARLTFLEAREPMKRWEARGTGPWRVIVRLRREGSDAYLDTAFDITLESGQIVFQKA
jgi:hypothetical protein